MAGLRDLSTRLILSNLRSQHPAAAERELQYQLIDFYPITDAAEMEMSAFARRKAQDISAGEIWLASAEDVVLAKLHCFRKGGEVSEKQWRDVLGVLKVQGERLGFAYLEHMAGPFGLTDLLIRAREDAGTI
jgi:hypothetical protein